MDIYGLLVDEVDNDSVSISSINSP